MRDRAARAGRANATAVIYGIRSSTLKGYPFPTPAKAPAAMEGFYRRPSRPVFDGRLLNAIRDITL